MDIDISNLKCPQYVNFESDIINNSNFYNGLNTTASSLSATDVSKMDEEDYFASSPRNRSTPSGYVSGDSDLYRVSSNSYQQSPSGYSLRPTSEVEYYPVTRNVNHSLNDSIKKKTKMTRKTTKTKPFALKESLKRKREDELVPLAEQVAAFHRKTPQRFHTVGSKEFQPQHWSPLQITQPKSPNFQASKRVRGTDVLSREEIEDQEVEEMKRYRFRARPISKNILNKRQSLKASKKLLTKAKDIHLRTAQRAAETYAKNTEQEKPYEFRARPIPTAIFEGPQGIKEKPSAPVTIAKTPKFALKERAEKWKILNHLNETTVEAPNFKAQPLPVFDPFVVKHEKKPIVVQPFSFETKDKERFAKKEQKIQEVIEKENKPFVFKAQPMPSCSPSSLPVVPKRPSTEPQPFNIHMEEKFRHSSFNSSMEQPCPTFKARPATVLKKQPFIPERPGKCTTDVQEVHLHTDVRASERLKLKEINLIKEKEHEEALKRMQLLQEEEERREIEQIRKAAEFKANPIKQFKPLDIKPSEKPLTQPVSPHFKTSERLQTKN